MESSTRTEELRPADEPASADVASADVHPSMIASIREQCSACGAAMASDQRYCVECGERRGAARVPLMDGLTERAREAPAARRAPRRPRMSVDSTLIAGIGTLLLAMGVGVLIGRSGNTSTKSPPRPGRDGRGRRRGKQRARPRAHGAPPPATGGASKETGRDTYRGGYEIAVEQGPSSPPPKTVKVGSPGKGPGYQHGHFTGNFFGKMSRPFQRTIAAARRELPDRAVRPERDWWTAPRTPGPAFGATWTPSDRAAGRATGCRRPRGATATRSRASIWHDAG